MSFAEIHGLSDRIFVRRAAVPSPVCMERDFGTVNCAPVLLRMPPFRAAGREIGTCDQSWDNITPDDGAEGSTSDLAVLDLIWRERVGGEYVARGVPVFETQRSVAVSLHSPGSSLGTVDYAIQRWGAHRLVAVLSCEDPVAHKRISAAIRARGVQIIDAGLNPHQLIDPCQVVVADQIDDLVLLGLCADREVWTLGGADLKRESREKAARLIVKSTHYTNPFSGEAMHVEEVVSLLAFWGQIIRENRDVAACYGMAWWKRRRMSAFFDQAPGAPVATRSVSRVLAQARRSGKAVASWSTRSSNRLLARAAKAAAPVWRVEDGFIRSVGLGSDLLPPASIVLDRRGIYYDPTRESDLEFLLATHAFDETIRARGRSLIARVVKEQVSKYGADSSDFASLINRSGTVSSNRRRILVPGQVADDQSVLRGGAGVSGNLDLLQRVRRDNPEAYIIYRPHPDVEAGHRAGAIEDEVVLGEADAISRGGSMAVLLNQIDEVHTLTSLTGFEALLRNISVSVWGQPFYAGWGLTIDHAPQLPRRGRNLLIEELVAGTLILYPRYIDPLTGLPCTPEVLLDRLADKSLWVLPLWSRIRRIQGNCRRQTVRIWNLLSRVLSHER